MEVCDTTGQSECTVCGVTGTTGASDWETVDCEVGSIRGNQIYLDKSSSVLQFCEIQVYGKSQF